MQYADVMKFKKAFHLTENATICAPVLRYHGFIIAEYYWAWSGEYFINFAEAHLVMKNGETPHLRTASLDEAMQFMAIHIMPSMNCMRPAYIRAKCDELSLTTPYAKEFADIKKAVRHADKNCLWHLGIRHSESHLAAFKMLGIQERRHYDAEMNFIL